MKKKIVYCMIAITLMLLQCQVLATPVIYPNPRAVPDDVYVVPYADTQFTTTYAPWLKQFHFMNEHEKSEGIYGGESCQQIRHVAISPIDANVMYFVTDTSGVWKTTTGGQHWYNTTANITQNYGLGLVCDNQDIGTAYVYMRGAGAFKTVDGGKTWALILEDKSEILGLTSNKFAQDNSGTLYIAAGNGIYRLSKEDEDPVNMYSTYQNLTGNASARFSDIYVSGNGQDIYVAGDGTDDTGTYKPGLYISHDAGETWTVKTSITAVKSVTVNPDDDSVYVAAGYKIYKVTNYDETFSEVYSSATWTFSGIKKFPIYNLRYGPKIGNERYLYMSLNEVNNPLRKSSDNGNNFSYLITNNTATNDAFIGQGRNSMGGYYKQGFDINSETGEIVFAYDGIEKAHADGSALEWIGSGFSGLSIIHMNMDSSGKILLHATDMGTVVSNSCYTENNYPTFDITNNTIITKSVVDPDNSNRIIAFSGQNNTDKSELGIVISTDGGNSFGNIISSTKTISNTAVLEYDNYVADKIYASEYTSTDNGNTWTKRTDGKFIRAISKNDSNKMIATMTSGNNNTGIFYTDDGGVTWSEQMYWNENDQSAVTYNVEFCFDIVNDSKVWYASTYAFGYYNLKTGKRVALSSAFGFNRYLCFYTFKQNPNDANHILVATRPGFGDATKDPRLYETIDGGKTFRVVPGLYGSFTQSITFSTTTEEAFIGGHGGTFIYDYNAYDDYLERKVLNGRYNSSEKRLYIEGNMDANVNAVIMIADKDNHSCISYINTSVTNSNGVLEAEFKYDGEIGSNDCLIVGLSNGKKFIRNIEFDNMIIEPYHQFQYSIEGNSLRVVSNTNNAFIGNNKTSHNIVAFYNNDVMVNYAVCNNFVGSCVLPIPENADRAKVFAFSNLNTIIPLATACDIEIK